MARISGVNLPKEKRIYIGLTYIYGIGRNLAMQILEATGVDPMKKVEALSPEEENKLREYISKTPTEGELRRKVALDIKRLQDIGSYRGFRHRRKLPVRGQRTKTNARTKRGKRVTMGSGRRKETKT